MRVTYKKLLRKFEKELVELQGVCEHTVTIWYDKQWRIGAYADYKVRVCQRCNKVVEEKPTKIERELARKKMVK